MSKKKLKSCTLYAQGMHCASCEILIEKKLIKQNNIKTVDASTGSETISIQYHGDKPSSKKLDKLFKKEGYLFSEQPFKEKDTQNEPFIKLNKNGQVKINRQKLKTNSIVVLISTFLILGFWLLNRSDLAAMFRVNPQSSAPVFILFGIMAGLSSCAALVGGIILSMSKQWGELYAKDDSLSARIQPHLFFNAGRIASYIILGGILGAIGGFLQLSISITTMLVIGVSIIMVLLSLQMLGVKSFQRFQIKMPKFITKNIADESKFSGKYMPTIMGALTFFLPCGFTITAQGFAITSGSALQGAMIMMFFALGTLPMLLFIGLSSTGFSRKPHLSNIFLKIAGILVMFFALYNINSQLNVLGYKSFTDAFSNPAMSANTDLPPIKDGIQVLKMKATASGYSPNSLKVRAGIPVKWEIEDKGTNGCTNAVISKSLFSGEIKLTPGKTSTKTFTPEEPGKYKFSCWMGMVSGVMEVVDEDGSVGDGGDFKTSPVPSSSSGCSGSCGGSCGGGCGSPSCSVR